MRRSPFNYNDDQIKALEDRMNKDEDKNLYGSYAAAARYYQSKDQPLLPQGGSQLGYGGRPISEAKWKEEIQDPKSPYRNSNRRERQKSAREAWAKARAEFRNR